jgi:hypothetical protein
VSSKHDLSDHASAQSSNQAARSGASLIVISEYGGGLNEAESTGGFAGTHSGSHGD